MLAPCLETLKRTFETGFTFPLVIMVEVLLLLQWNTK
jgi:hypothetical protein